MEDFSIPKDGVKMSQPTLGQRQPWVLLSILTQHLRPSQATLASPQHPFDFLLVVFSHTNSRSTGGLIPNLQYLPRVLGAEREAAARLLLWLAGKKEKAKNS